KRFSIVEIAVYLPDDTPPFENNAFRPQLLVNHCISAIREGNCPIEAVSRAPVRIRDGTVQRVAHSAPHPLDQVLPLPAKRLNRTAGPDRDHVPRDLFHQPLPSLRGRRRFRRGRSIPSSVSSSSVSLWRRKRSGRRTRVRRRPWRRRQRSTSSWWPE